MTARWMSPQQDAVSLDDSASVCMACCAISLPGGVVAVCTSTSTSVFSLDLPAAAPSDNDPEEGAAAPAGFSPSLKLLATASHEELPARAVSVQDQMLATMHDGKVCWLLIADC